MGVNRERTTEEISTNRAKHSLVDLSKEHISVICTSFITSISEFFSTWSFLFNSVIHPFQKKKTM